MKIKITKGSLLIAVSIVACVSFFSLFHSTEAASLRLGPGNGNFLVGSTFDVSIILDTKGKPVNFIEVELNFPSDKIQITSPSVGRSVIDFWPTSPMFSNQEGRLYFAGGSPEPGINTSEGVVLTLTFRVISSGEATIQFGNKTSVLAHDGKGTKLLNQTSSAFFRFSPPPPLGPIISSPTHPDQERWYRDNNPVFVWPKGLGAEAYSFKIDRDPAGFPDTQPDSIESTASFANLENGMWYFHLREKAQSVWGGAGKFSLNIDNEPPSSFRINISPSTRTSNRNPILRFFTTDTLSGLDRFEMKIVSLSSERASQSLFFNVDSPYQVLDLQPGRYQIVVRAFDKAQNTRDETTTLTILAPGSWLFDSEGIDLYVIFVPWRWISLGFLVVFLISFMVISRLWFEHRHHVRHAFGEDIKKLLHAVKIVKKEDNKKTYEEY